MKTLIALLLLPAVAFGQSAGSEAARAFSLGFANQVNRHYGVPQYGYHHPPQQFNYQAENEWRQNMDLMKAQQQYLQAERAKILAESYQRDLNRLNNNVEILNGKPPGFE